MWVVESLNLTQLGGPMGSERITTNWTEYFNDLDSAKKYCEKEYGLKKPKIKWTQEKKGIWSSGDLFFVEYTITLIKPKH